MRETKLARQGFRNEARLVITSFGRDPCEAVPVPRSLRPTGRLRAELFPPVFARTTLQTVLSAPALGGESPALMRRHEFHSFWPSQGHTSTACMQTSGSPSPTSVQNPSILRKNGTPLARVNSWSQVLHPAAQSRLTIASPASASQVRTLLRACPAVCIEKPSPITQEGTCSPGLYIERDSTRCSNRIVGPPGVYRLLVDEASRNERPSSAKSERPALLDWPSCRP
jgi:hypothetical protein